MNIRCNDKPVQIEGSTVAGALLELGYEGAIVATALNGVFVAKTQRAKAVLQPGDRLEILAPMQGG